MEKKLTKKVSPKETAKKKFKPIFLQMVFSNLNFFQLYFMSTSQAHCNYSVLQEALLKRDYYFPLTGKVSKFNDAYHCTIPAYQLTKNELRIYICERGGMSMGYIQSPRSSKNFSTMNRDFSYRLEPIFLLKMQKEDMMDI